MQSVQYVTMQTEPGRHGEILSYMIARCTLQGLGVFIVKVLTKIRCLSRHPYLLRSCRQAQRGRTRGQNCLWKLSWMSRKDRQIIGELEPNLGCDRTIIPSLPTNEFRNRFLGWGAD